MLKRGPSAALGLKTIGGGAGFVGVGDQPVFQRWEGAVAAVGPFAQAAGQADPHLGAFQIKAIRVHHLCRAGDVAAHGDDRDGGGSPPAGGGRRTVRAKQRKVDLSGSSATLYADRAGGGEGEMRQPFRARSRQSGRGKAGGREAFADIARRVHPQEEEGHAACAGPLQRGQAVAGLFEAHAEAGGQGLDVVAQFARGLKGRVRRASAARRRHSSAGRCESSHPASGEEARPAAFVPPPLAPRAA